MPVVRCLNCQTPLTADGLTRQVIFPADTRAVMALLEGRLNMVQCPVCKAALSLRPGLAALNALTSEMVACRLGSDTLAALEKLGRVQFCADYGDLRHVVATWSTRLLAGAGSTGEG